MFRAALAAQTAGEPYVSAHRVAGSLLRTEAVHAFCSRARIDSALVLEAADEAQSLSFEECERRFAKEQQPDLQLRPLDPILKPVFDTVMERHGHLAISPLALLLEVVRAHPTLAARLAPLGLTQDALTADVGKENE
jgi:hypothetical protein